ncbi:hypothetical protein EVAR_91089_1 [Eumeta japonica]|uniref:Uncharacterized protein n=1 Tax=Eumeta variegata TaxID=151549 RepID=A0A4C1SPP0_EUMVA|nr:hypothetical protein EVAR_91089_1 [Eumeta japonica]
MITRSSDKSRLSDSFKKNTGSSTASLNNITIRPQAQTGAMPRVLRSPIATQSEEGGMDDQGAIGGQSPEAFQDLIDMNQQNSGFGLQQGEPVERAPRRSSLNPNVEPFINPSSNAPLITRSNVANIGPLNSFESITAIMEQAMRNTQEEFRRELVSIKESIAQMGISQMPSRPRELFPNIPASVPRNNESSFDRRTGSQEHSRNNVNDRALPRQEPFMTTLKLKSGRYIMTVQVQSQIFCSKLRPCVGVQDVQMTICYPIFISFWRAAPRNGIGSLLRRTPT